MIEDRQTKLQTLNFDRIDISKEYGITKRLKDLKDIKDLINKIVDDSFNKSVEGKHDVDYIHSIKIEFEQPHNYDFVRVKDGPPSVKLKVDLYTWETKSEMYSRRAYKKRELEEKTLALEKQASQLGYKLEKIANE